MIPMGEEETKTHNNRHTPTLTSDQPKPTGKQWLSASLFSIVILSVFLTPILFFHAISPLSTFPIVTIIGVIWISQRKNIKRGIYKCLGREDLFESLQGTGIPYQGSEKQSLTRKQWTIIIGNIVGILLFFAGFALFLYYISPYLLYVFIPILLVLALQWKRMRRAFYVAIGKA